jgi:predicted 3-demethylubiquinone-9 3-methyltransferase (glyoxalase superfamily)
VPVLGVFGVHQVQRRKAVSKISPCLWFDGEAEEAANFYVSLLPNSRIDHVQKNVTDSPAGKAGTVLVVAFTLAGQRFLALNGGTRFEYTHAISFQVDCADQAEVDRLWDALSDGGAVEQCGWLKDRYGVSWQITPRVLVEMLGDPDQEKAQRVMQAMMQMIKIDIEGLRRACDGVSAA